MKRMLLIDDDPLYGSVFTRKALARGIELDHYGSLVESLYEETLSAYDAVIVDCMMPGVDGFEVSNYFATFLRGVPIVLVSQSDVPFQKFLEEPQGAKAFIAKRQGYDAVLNVALDL